MPVHLRQLCPMDMSSYGHVCLLRSPNISDRLFSDVSKPPHWSKTLTLPSNVHGDQLEVRHSDRYRLQDHQKVLMAMAAVLAFAILLALAVECSLAQDCGRRKYDVSQLPAKYQAGESIPGIPVKKGTTENIQTGLPFDFTGVWWMRGNELPEYLISFADLQCDELDFSVPVTCTWPNNLKHRWSWDDSFLASFLMTFTALVAPDAQAYRQQVIFYNETYGEIQTFLMDFPFIGVDKWPLEKLNEDEWLRPTLFQEGSLLSDTVYTLTRVVRGDGTATQFFSIFVSEMQSQHRKLVVFDSDSTCKRSCMGLFLASCWFCDIICW